MDEAESHERPGLGERLRRLLSGRRSPRRSYDLDVVDQWLLRTLYRFPGCTYRHLEAELAAIRGSTPAQVVESLLKLEELGLLERAAQTELMAKERQFLLTRSGKKVTALVPETPLSPTIFYP